MSKYTFVGGDIIEFIGGSDKSFAKEDIINSSLTEVIFNGEENGKIYGTNKEAPLISRYFIEGYWASDKEGKNRITEAELGDKVYFIVKFKDLEPEKTEIEFELFELVNSHYIWLGFLLTYISERGEKISLIRVTDENDENREEKPYKIEKINNKQAVISFILSENGALKNMLLKEKFLELFFWIKYHTEKKKLPEKKENYLIINRPKIQDGKLILVQASTTHLLPELYDSKTGDAWIVELKENKEYAEDLQELAIPGSNTVSKLEKDVYDLAIRRLGKGELVLNTGKITRSKRIFSYTVSDLDNRFSQSIKMAVNKGNFKPGETTKGINQLEAMVRVGKTTNTLMKVAKIANIGGDLLTVATMMVDAANGDKMDIPFMPPFVPMIVDQQLNEMYDDFHETFLKDLNIALCNGNLADVYSVFSKNKAEEMRKGYDLIFLNDADLEKVLTNSVVKKNELNYQNAPGDEYQNAILIQSGEAEDDYGRMCLVFYVHAIFVNEFIKEEKI